MFKRKGSKLDTLLLFICAMKIQILTGHVTTQHIFMVFLTNYVVELIISQFYVNHILTVIFFWLIIGSSILQVRLWKY